jgi:N-acetylglucosaminyl-diphospho-decaprenol L-rhamnosyltransferase
MADIAVVIVNYNARATLPATLSELGSDLEVIVVDNDSSDGSALLVEAPARLIEAGENLGFGKASNVGFAATAAPFVLFLNPDAVIAREAVRRLAAALDADPGLGAVGPRVVGQDGTPDPHAARRRPTVAAFLFQVTSLARRFPASPLFGTFFDRGRGTRDVACLSGACMMVRRQATGARPFDERFYLFGEDLDLCMRLGREGWRLRYIDDVICEHVGGHSMGQVTPNAVLEGYRAWVLLLARWRGWPAGAGAWLVAVGASLVQLPVWLVSAALRPARRRDSMQRARGSALVLAWAFGLRKGGVPW